MQEAIIDIAAGSALASTLQPSFMSNAFEHCQHCVLSMRAQYVFRSCALGLASAVCDACISASKDPGGC
jgi:hypothetical protein